jgi:hypothetical protein
MSTKHRAPHQHGHANNTTMSEEPVVKTAPAKQKFSEEDRSRLIQVRAYGLWEEAGKLDGHENRERFWFDAEREISRKIATATRP